MDPARGIRLAVKAVCEELLPQAIGLTDAFGFTDWELDRFEGHSICATGRDLTALLAVLSAFMMERSTKRCGIVRRGTPSIMKRLPRRTTLLSNRFWSEAKRLLVIQKGNCNTLRLRVSFCLVPWLNDPGICTIYSDSISNLFLLQLFQCYTALRP